MIKVGFTGTRHGMTGAQQSALLSILYVLKTEYDGIELHHGDCVGADAQAHELAGKLKAVRVVHPPKDEEHRAFVTGQDFTREAKTHFARNRDIVRETHGLIAAPYELEKQQRGGTWYTVEYALRCHRPTYIILRDGTSIGWTREFAR